MKITGAREYLLGYNMLNLVLWLACLVALCHLVFDEGLPADIGTRYWETYGALVLIAQSLAALEIGHACIGLVKSSPIMTVIQVCSRLHVVWGVMRWVTPASEAVVLCIVAWSIAEIVRYAYYVSALITDGQVGSIITWLRYSLFLGLYPMGVAGEMWAIWHFLSMSKEMHSLRHWPYAMPNCLNFELDLWVLYVFVFVSYPPGLHKMYSHMLRQRRKVLKTKTKDE